MFVFLCLGVGVCVSICWWVDGIFEFYISVVPKKISLSIWRKIIKDIFYKFSRHKNVSNLYTKLMDIDLLILFFCLCVILYCYYIFFSYKLYDDIFIFWLIIYNFILLKKMIIFNFICVEFILLVGNLMLLFVYNFI